LSFNERLPHVASSVGFVGCDGIVGHQWLKKLLQNVSKQICPRRNRHEQIALK
jgi:hypothetical protein